MNKSFERVELLLNDKINYMSEIINVLMNSLNEETGADSEKLEFMKKIFNIYVFEIKQHLAVHLDLLDMEFKGVIDEVNDKVDYMIENETEEDLETLLNPLYRLWK